MKKEKHELTEEEVEALKFFMPKYLLAGDWDPDLLNI